MCLADDVVVGTRVVDGLADASRADRRSAEAVLDVLTQVLPVVAERRDGHRWVEQAAERGAVLGRRFDLPAELRSLPRTAGPRRSRGRADGR